MAKNLRYYRKLQNLTLKLIYVLEDDPDILQLVKLLLSRRGYEVKAFSTAHDFNDRIMVELPALCILDVNLPDGNGLDICPRLNSAHKTRGIPVLIMSAKTFPQEKYDNSGASEFISKPFSVDVFLTAVGNLFDIYNSSPRS
jgi:DNA-binding response OmpR family regulator